MKKLELWRTKVADLKKFAKGSLKQLREDQDNLLRLLTEYDAALARLQRIIGGIEEAQQVTVIRFRLGKPKVVWRKRIYAGDFRKKLAEQRKSIPLYQGAIKRSEQNGILLSTCLKRLTEVELLLH